MFAFLPGHRTGQLRYSGRIPPDPGASDPRFAPLLFFLPFLVSLVACWSTKLCHFHFYSPFGWFLSFFLVNLLFLASSTSCIFLWIFRVVFGFFFFFSFLFFETLLVHYAWLGVFVLLFFCSFVEKVQFWCHRRLLPFCFFAFPLLPPFIFFYSYFFFSSSSCFHLLYRVCIAVPEYAGIGRLLVCLFTRAGRSSLVSCDAQQLAIFATCLFRPMMKILGRFFLGHVYRDASIVQRSHQPCDGQSTRLGFCFFFFVLFSVIPIIFFRYDFDLIRLLWCFSFCLVFLECCQFLTFLLLLLLLFF